MNPIQNWEEVPIFESEQAEALFWADNKPHLRLMEGSVAGVSEVSESVTITLRMDPRMLAPDQTVGPVPVSELPKHDQAMAQ